MFAPPEIDVPGKMTKRWRDSWPKAKSQWPTA